MTPVPDQPTPATVDDLHAYYRGERHSFHMPGHKQHGGVHPHFAEVFGAQLLHADVSEMGGFDYLHAPSGSIAEAQTFAAHTFGASATFFLVNGSTGGNLSAIHAFVGDGDNIVMMRGSHRSVYTGAVLAGANPFYLPYEHDTHEDGWFLPQHPNAITDLPTRAAAVHVTRPNYYGMAVDLAPYVDLARRLGALLIVDEAHGSHFGFHADLPSSALASGADIVIQSTHKTLSALTQASMLHVGPSVELAPIRRSLGMLQSSSPSALLTISLDLATSHLAGQGRTELAQTIARAHWVRRDIASLPGLRVLDRPTTAGKVQTDPTKIVIDVRGLGIGGFAAAAWLRAHRQLHVELSDFHRIVCSLTIGDTDESCAYLVDALRALADAPHSANPTASIALPPLPPQRQSLRAAQHDNTSATPVAITECAGRICAEYVIPYPPGIPLLVPGEEVTTDILIALNAFRLAGAKIVGPNDLTGETLIVKN
jgi:arginine decarboxylase